MTHTIQDIQTYSAARITKETATVPNNLRVGQFVAQGDVYFYRFHDQLPKDIVPVTEPNNQIVPGNTKGSRHCFDRLSNLQLFTCPRFNELCVAFVVFEGETIITHPEHNHLRFTGGTYLITIQRMYAEELKRIAD